MFLNKLYNNNVLKFKNNYFKKMYSDTPQENKE